jgi:cytochrome oxidase Cu insertion factor (SCO1/SenC/PrrC family)
VKAAPFSRRLWFLTLLALLATLPGCRRADRGLPFDDALPDFSLIDQDGQTLTGSDLKGKVWVAAFIFTRCRTSCLQITGAMRSLQEEFRNQNDFRLVSVTVDPDHDTPAVLKKYAGNFAADEQWRFLTGPADRVHALVEQGFWEAAEKNATPGHDPGNEVMHSTKVWLVDQNGRKRARFDGANAEEMTELRRKIALLLREGP